MLLLSFLFNRMEQNRLNLNQLSPLATGNLQFDIYCFSNLQNSTRYIYLLEEIVITQALSGTLRALESSVLYFMLYRTMHYTKDVYNGTLFDSQMYVHKEELTEPNYLFI